MNMTREEAIELKAAVGRLMYSDNKDIRDYNMLIDFIESTLRPVSQEQVEQIKKVWTGCDFCNRADFGEFGFEITKHYAKICSALGSWRFPKHEQFLFCPKCGKPLTGEAMQMVMKRLEATYEQNND